MSRTTRLAASILVLALAASTAVRADFIDLWANKTDVPADKAPPRGHSKVLVIPVQIDYSGSSGTYTALDLTALTTYFTAPASTATFNFQGYLKVASSNRYTADVTIAPLVHYTGCPATLMDSSNPSACMVANGTIVSLTSDMDFVRDVFSKAHAAGVDFSKFDINGTFSTADGTIDGVIMVVNIPGTHITLPIYYVNGGSNLNGGNGGSLVLDGVKIPYVAIGGGTTINSQLNYTNAATAEFGKELGLASLGYAHTMGTDAYPNWKGLHFSMMGDWQYEGSNFLPDAESRRALGWQDQHVVSGTETLTLQPAANGGYAVKLGMMSASRMEYFLAEARGPIGGYDTQVVTSAGAATWGLAVYHLDWGVGPKATEGQFINHLINCLNCTPWHPFMQNVESGGQFDLVFNGSTDLGANGVGDDKVLFNGNNGTNNTLGSIPGAGVLSASNRYLGTNWYDGSDSGIKITNVMVNADHTVTATFTAPTTTNPCSDVTCPPLMVCQATGVLAGSCIAMAIPVADGGSTTPPNDAGTGTSNPGDSGCATSGSETSSAALWLLPFALLGVFALRKQRA